MRAITEPRTFLPSRDAIQLLSARFSTQPMLPLLRSLDLMSVSGARLRTCVPLLVSPHLAHVRLYFGDNSPERCLPVINTLIRAAGSLESVEVIPEFDGPEMQDAVSKLLLNCNPNLLSSFCVASPISEAALLHAAQLPELREFSVRGGTPGLSDPLPLTMFPSLRTILISTGRLPTWFEVLRHIQSKHLKDLSIDFEDNGNLSAISSHLQYSGIHRTLTGLRICPRGGWIIDGVSIAPLLVLGELTSLTIFKACEDQCIFLLSDEDIEHLVKAMPKLEDLSLGTTPCPHQMPDNLTVKSLLAIAKHCKALETLRIHINCKSIVMGTGGREFPGPFNFHTEVPSEVISSDYDGCLLRSATFGSCPIPMGEEGGTILALTLLQLFPRLNDVRWYPFENLSPWSSMGVILAVNNRVRRNLAELGEFMCAYSRGIGLIMPQLVSPPSTTFLLSDPQFTKYMSDRSQLPSLLLPSVPHVINCTLGVRALTRNPHDQRNYSWIP